MITHLRMLIDSIRHLGLITGFNYFRAYLAALKDPEFILRWADACDKHARKLEFFNSNPEEAEASRAWANALRECDRKIKEQEIFIDNYYK